MQHVTCLILLGRIDITNLIIKRDQRRPAGGVGINTAQCYTYWSLDHNELHLRLAERQLSNHSHPPSQFIKVSRERCRLPHHSIRKVMSRSTNHASRQTDVEARRQPGRPATNT